MRRQCELIGLTRSKVYHKPAQPSAERLAFLEEVMSRMDYWHTTLPYIGSKKLVRKLKADGLKVGRKLVRRLMAEMGIQGAYPKPNLSKRNFKEGIVPYLLKNKLVFLANQVWSIDITYIKMHRSHMYLTAIIDWHSRYIVGWDLSDTLDAACAIRAVRNAVEACGVPAFLNSDQGSQFTSKEYRALLEELGITQSMDGKGRWADNILIERWFRSLKVEEIYPNEYRSPRELRKAVGLYIRQYNMLRPHEALDYQTPEEVYRSCFAPSAAGLDSLGLAG